MGVFSRLPITAAPAAPDDPREVLRAAQAVARTATEAAQAAAALAARALTRVEVARVEVAAHAGLDAQVAAFHVAVLRTGDPAERTALPPDLVEARRARAAAVEALADAEAAAALLAGEAQAAASAAAAVQVTVTAGTFAVLRRAVSDLVAEMRRAETRAGQLRAAAAGYVAILTHVDQVFSPVPPEVGTLGFDSLHPHILDLARADPRDVAPAWSDFRQALMRDADAPVPEALRPVA